MLRLYDTLSGHLHPLEVKNKVVKALVCGPTVYDYAHAGHARMLLFYDFAARFIRYAGGVPVVVVNITDVDNKIYHKAHTENTSRYKISSKFINELFSDLALLGIQNTFSFARVSDYVELTTKLIKGLIENKKAYYANGNIFLDTSTVNMGSLSKMSKQELEDCRLDIGPSKKSPADIMLWNTSETFDGKFHDDMLGDGIPWWHIQDTTVAMGNFGGIYDIQGGATELVYPHHEFHLAQLQAITSNQKPVKFWTHVGLVYVKGKKMSKSLMNVTTIRSLLKEYSPNVLKLYLLSKHYRQPLEFSKNGLDKFVRIDGRIMASLEKQKFTNGTSKLAKQFFECIENDFDTEGAMKIMVSAAEKNDCGMMDMVKAFGLQY